MPHVALNYGCCEPLLVVRVTIANKLHPYGHLRSEMNGAYPVQG
jgi:hypothetical protein